MARVGLATRPPAPKAATVWPEPRFPPADPVRFSFEESTFGTAVTGTVTCREDIMERMEATAEETAAEMPEALTRSRGRSASSRVRKSARAASAAEKSAPTERRALPAGSAELGRMEPVKPVNPGRPDTPAGRFGSRDPPDRPDSRSFSPEVSDSSRFSPAKAVLAAENTSASSAPASRFRSRIAWSRPAPSSSTWTA